LEAPNRDIYTFQKDFLLLEEAHAQQSSLRNIALLLLTRYFYDAKPISRYKDPTWEYLIDAYDLPVDDLVGIIQKKKRSGYIALDNIKCLIETYMPAQRQESNIGSAWLKEQFLNNYTN
jgi:hypothetical protein